LRRAAAALAAAALAASGALAKDAPRPKFRWPVIGQIEQAKDGRGVDISIPEGAAVHAAADGEVIYASDEIASYGRMLVIRHADDYVTTYAHLSDMAVTKGVAVKRGQIIGKSGRTGEASRPMLHFELRRGETELDPIGFLSPR
jgi:murein DD-endopeptidase MepM/ murein hydrolase activator NlpD